MNANVSDIDIHDNNNYSQPPLKFAQMRLLVDHIAEYKTHMSGTRVSKDTCALKDNIWFMILSYEERKLACRGCYLLTNMSPKGVNRRRCSLKR